MGHCVFVCLQRKIPEAALLWEQVSGYAADTTLSLVGLACNEDPGPSKRPCHADSDGVLEKVTSIEKKLCFLYELAKAFNCSVCKCTARDPVVSRCC